MKKSRRHVERCRGRGRVWTYGVRGAKWSVRCIEDLKGGGSQCRRVGSVDGEAV